MNAKHLKPTIVLDVDGVLLTWQAMLIPFLLSKGMPITQKLRTALLEGTLIWTDEIPEMDLKLIEEYNASIFCRELPPFERSLPEIIKMLSKKYNLVCLTAFSHNIDAQKNRIQNLEYYFGNAISEIRFVGIRDSKEEELKLYCKQHNVVLFVDDNEIHVKMATDLIGKNRVYHLKDSSQWTNLASILLKQRSAG